MLQREGTLQFVLRETAVLGGGDQGGEMENIISRSSYSYDSMPAVPTRVSIMTFVHLNSSFKLLNWN